MLRIKNIYKTNIEICGKHINYRILKSPNDKDLKNKIINIK